MKIGDKGIFDEHEVKPTDLTTVNVIGVDPGAIKLLSLYNSQNGSTMFYSKRQHHWLSGVIENKTIQNKWRKPNDVKEAEILASKHSLRVYSYQTWRHNCKQLLKGDIIMWEYYSHPRYANLKFKMHVKKQNTYNKLGKYIKQWAEKDDKSNSPKPIVLAYGKAKFQTSFRGQISGPRTEMIKKLSHVFPVVLINEFRSTKLCSTCHKELVEDKKAPVPKQEQKHKRVSIYRCTTCKSYRHRDRNAARNIYNFLRCTLTKSGEKLQHMPCEQKCIYRSIAFCWNSSPP